MFPFNFKNKLWGSWIFGYSTGNLTEYSDSVIDQITSLVMVEKKKKNEITVVLNFVKN